MIVLVLRWHASVSQCGSISLWYTAIFKDFDSTALLCVGHANFLLQNGRTGSGILRNELSRIENLYFADRIVKKSVFFSVSVRYVSFFFLSLKFSLSSSSKLKIKIDTGFCVICNRWMSATVLCVFGFIQWTSSNRLIFPNFFLFQHLFVFL